MRFARTYVLAFSCLFLVFPLFAQQTATTIQRDPQAINLLAQSLAAAGGPVISTIQDFTATGTITYSWANRPVSGSVNIYSKGLTEFRMESSVPAGTQELVVSGQEATLTPAYSTKAESPIFGMVTAGSLTFPAARISQILSNASISVVFLGPVEWNGSQTYQIHIALPPDPRLTAGPNFSGLGEFNLYFDAHSYQLLGLTERIWWDSDLRQSYAHELLFSDYRPINGMSVPFTITEKMSSQQTWSVSLNSISFNTGLSDALFQPQAL